MSGRNFFKDLNREASFAVEVYANPTEFKTPQEYLAAISEVLENLCQIKGVEPIPLPEEWVR